jgi:hypothetical protein
MRIGRRSFVLGALRGPLPAAAISTLFVSSSHSASAEPQSGHFPPDARSNFAQTNGIRTHYVTLGSGPLLIRLHGWPQTWFAWRDVRPRLGKRFTVVAPDLRGTGLSERIRTGYDKRTIAEDVRALILHAGAKHAHVVGHDMGGKVAYELAHLYPDAVSSSSWSIACYRAPRIWTSCEAVPGTTDFTWRPMSLKC